MSATTGEMKKKVLTLLLLRRGPDEVLLGRKKRGFGAGYFNGFGGKVEAGETVLEGAIREMEEESGLRLDPADVSLRGILDFEFDDNPQPWCVYVFHADGDALGGEPVETEEMAPVWTSVHALPFDQMWADDVHWYPLFLAGKLFTGRFAFTRTTTLVSFDLQAVTALPDVSLLG